MSPSSHGSSVLEVASRSGRRHFLRSMGGGARVHGTFTRDHRLIFVSCELFPPNVHHDLPLFSLVFHHGVPPRPAVPTTHSNSRGGCGHKQRDIIGSYERQDNIEQLNCVSNHFQSLPGWRLSISLSDVVSTNCFWRSRGDFYLVLCLFIPIFFNQELILILLGYYPFACT